MRGVYVDLTGKVFGKYTVLERSKRRVGCTTFWCCSCECGAVRHVDSHKLRRGQAKSCGCARGRLIDLTGKVFGRYTVTGLSEKPYHGSSFWICRCSCGAIRHVRSAGLRNGKSKSCGCLASELVSACRYKHGQSAGPNRKCTPEYQTWAHMCRRCYDKNSPDYSDYGARGLRVCRRWRKDFSKFFEDMGMRPAGHSIERVKNSLGYSPENCIWATPASQAANKRNNVNLTLDGRTQCLAAWSRELGISRTSIASRLKHGWKLRDALTIPPLPPYKKYRHVKQSV